MTSRNETRLMKSEAMCQLTHGAQSDVTEDDDDEDNTAHNVSAAPGERTNREMGEVEGKGR